MRMAIARGAAAMACAKGDPGAPDTSILHHHICHVLTSWRDTPDQMGLLSTQHMRLMQEGKGVA